MGLTFYTGGSKPSKPWPFTQIFRKSAPIRAITIFRLPLLGNPHGCIYEKVPYPTKKTILDVLSNLLSRYGEIVPKSGQAQIWEGFEDTKLTLSETPDYLIEFKQGENPGVRHFKYQHSRELRRS